MMSSEYDRLVEAWIAGNLTAAEELELFRNAQADVYLAKLIGEQRNVRIGIEADRAGLLDRLQGAGLRARVADLSKAVQVNESLSTTGAGMGIRAGLSGLRRWITGVLLVGGAAVGIYTIGDKASDSESTGTNRNSRSSIESRSPSGAMQDDHGSGRVDGPTVRRDDNVSPRERVISGRTSAPIPSPAAPFVVADTAKASSPDVKENGPPRRRNEEIVVPTEIDGYKELP